MHVLEQVIGGLLDGVELGGGRDRRVHQAGDVAHRHRQVAQDLQDGHGLGDPLVQRGVGKANLHLADGLVEGGEGAADVLLQFIVEGDGGGQPAHRLIGHGLGAAFALEHVLDHLDGGAQTDATGGLGQGAQQVQEDVEVGREEGVEVDEARPAEVGVVILSVLQLGVVAQPLAMGVEQRAQCRFPRGRFAQQAAVADLLDVAGFQFDLDREAVLELVELVRVQDRAGIILGEGLLGGGDDPHLAVAQALKVLGQTVEVEDQVVAGGNVLADLVDDEEDVPLATLLADDVEHLLRLLVLGFGPPLHLRREGRGGGKQVGIELVGDLGQQGGDQQGAVVHVGPGFAGELGGNP